MNDKNYYLNVINKSFKELNPIDAGYEKCESMHSFGPSIREYWLIHYVVDGTGKIVKGEKTFTAHRGQAFLIRPDEICTYTADKYDPWEYIWIGFTGSMAEKFNCLEDVFNMRGAVFYEILQAKEYKMCRTEFLASKLFMLYAQIFSSMKQQTDYVTQALDYINAKYADEISIGGIAKMIGIDRTYLSKLFKKETSVSMCDYLVNIRMKKADEFLKKGHSVCETAALVGYKDVSNFSRMYKKKTGTSPVCVKSK